MQNSVRSKKTYTFEKHFQLFNAQLPNKCMETQGQSVGKGRKNHGDITLLRNTNLKYVPSYQAFLRSGKEAHYNLILIIQSLAIVSMHSQYNKSEVDIDGRGKPLKL